jgi:pilus assembly protein CpaF
MLALTIREKNGEERQLIMDQEDVTIGRAATCEIVLPRNNISKRHARLVDKHDKVVVVDLRSTNGTYVNGRRITAPELLTFDDKVYIGDFVIRLTRPSEQHPSQRIVGAFVADAAVSSPDLEPRGARLPTQAADISELQSLAEPPPPPPPADAFTLDDEAPPPPIDDEFPPPDEEAATRAISLAMVDALDQGSLARPAAPPLPPTRVAAPPAPLAETLATKGSTQAFAPRTPPPRPPAESPRPPANPAVTPPMQVLTIRDAPDPVAPSSPEPVAAPLASAPTEVAPSESEASPTLPLTKASVASAAPAAPLASVAPVTPAAPLASAAPAAELPPEDPWRAWNLAIAALVTRYEASHHDPAGHADLHEVVEDLLDLAVEAGDIASDVERAALVEDVIGELGGLGPLGELERDPSVRVVRVNGPAAIFVARSGEPFAPNGRVFASSRSLRRALRLLLQGSGVFVGESDNASAGLQEARLADGSTVRFIEPGGGGDPALIWRRPVPAAGTLSDLEARGLLSRAHVAALSKAARAGENILVCGPTSEERDALMSAIALAYGPDLRVVRVGDVAATPHADQVTLLPGALAGAAELSALEPGLVIFDPVEGRVIGDWALTALVAGCPVLASVPDSDLDRALRRLALAAELHASSAGGFGGRLVAEAVSVAVSLVRGSDGAVTVARVQALGGTFAPATTAMSRP